jgi:glutathione S-transferase
MNPARTTPVLETDDGRFLPESAAILFYLAEGTPFLPDDAFERAEVVRWLIYEQTDVIPTMGGLRFRLLVGRLTPDEPDAVRRTEGSLEVLRLLDEHLATRGFFVGGRYTIADIAIYGYSHLAHEAGIDMEPYENLRAWFERVEHQPRYIEDVEPYGANAAPGVGRSLYD